MDGRRWAVWGAFALLPSAFLAVMVVAPLWAVAAYDGLAWRAVLSDAYMLKRLAWTVFQAAATCVLVLPLGVPVAWVLALLAYPFVAKDVLSAWDALPPDYGRAAAGLGANGFQTAYRITFPLLKPALRRGLTLAAATCVGEFAATLFLSRPEWQTLTTLIYAYLGRAGADNYARAMVLTLLLSAFALGIFLLLDGGEGGKQTETL
ncbi:TPA: ABC transporter permease subunit [Neisseria meningitidis]